MAKQVINITESEIRQMVAESVQKILQEGETDEGLKNFFRGLGGVGRGIGNAVGNAVDNARMNGYQAQIQGMQNDNANIQQQIEALEASKEEKMDQAAVAAGNEIDKQINILKSKLGNVQGLQDKWDAAGRRINARQQTGYINNRQYTPQNATNPQQGNMNY
jgi:hypothetical protein